MIKIAYIIDNIATPSAGTEKQLLYLLNRLDRDKFEPHLVCLYPSEWMKNQVFPCPVHYLGVHSLFSLDFFKGRKKFKELHQEHNFDIVQTFFKDGNIIGTLFADHADCPVIISSRRNIGYWHDKLQISILRYLEKRTDYYLANSQSAVEMTIEIEKAERKKFTVIYNGLDLDRFKNVDPNLRLEVRDCWKISDDDILIGAVANLRPVKNIDIMIEAALLLKDDHPELKYVVIGEGPMRGELQQKIDSYDLKNRFFLAGRIDDVIGPLTAFDIAVLPSANESFSNSLIEYMAAGKPIIAGAVGGNVEAIADNSTGLLYNPSNPDELAEKIKTFLADRENAYTMGDCAAKTAFEKYDIDSMIKNHQEYYTRLVGSE